MVVATLVATRVRAERSIALQALAAPAIVALGAAIRLALISGAGFHPDEALYATWARLIATGQDVWLATRVVDKPPLFIYALAALFGTLGASEEIARVPNEAASIISVALTYLIARDVYDRRVALLSALALGPFLAFFKRYRPFIPVVERGAGLLLVAVGVLVFLNYYVVLNSWAASITPDWLLKRL